MAKEQEPSWEMSIDDVDRTLLEETARFMYVELSRGRLRGRAPEQIAEAAFQEAKAFVMVAQAHRNGKPIADKAKGEAPAYVLVHLWDGSLGPHGEPMMKPDTNEPVLEVQPVDRDAFAPNLPKDHPINQRYYPNARKSGRLCNAKGELLAAGNN